MPGARRSLASLASTAVNAVARRVSGAGTKSVKDDLSNDIVRYRGLSVAALQEIWDDVLSEELAHGTQLYVLTQEAVIEDENGNEVGRVEAGRTAAVRGKKRRDGWLKGQVAYVKGTVRFRPDGAETKPREDWTIEDVCEHMVLAETFRDQRFYLDVLMEQDEALVGKPFQGAFVSQARACSFEDLVAAIVNFYSAQGRDLARTFVWLDVFCANQPKLAVKDLDLAQEIRQQRDALLTHGLHAAIERFDERLIFFDKWDNPTPLTRMWCVWEVYGAVTCGRALDLIFAPGEDERFIELMQDDTPKAITQTLTNFDLANAKCHDKADERMIVAAVSSLDGGFHALNSVVLDQLRRWLAATAQRIVASRIEVEGRSLGVARLMHNIGWLAKDQGLYELSMRMYTDCLAIKKVNLGPRHPSVAITMFGIAQVLQKKGQYDAALAQLDEVLEIQQEQLGPRHPDVATTMYAMASSLQAKGQFDAALAQFEEVLEIRKEMLGPRKAEVANVMYAIASVLQAQGQNDAALAKFEEALEIAKDQLGPKHPKVAATMYAIAQVLRAKGQYDATLAQFEEVLQMRKEQLGAEHESAGVTNCQISLVMSELDRFADALAHAEESLTILRGSLDEDHPHFGFAKLAEGRALLGLGQKTEAVASLRRSIAILATALGQEHPDTAESLFWLAEALQGASEAERARAIRLDKLGRDHPLTLESEAQVARLGRKR